MLILFCLLDSFQKKCRKIITSVHKLSGRPFFASKHLNGLFSSLILTIHWISSGTFNLSLRHLPIIIKVLKFRSWIDFVCYTSSNVNMQSFYFQINWKWEILLFVREKMFRITYLVLENQCPKFQRNRIEITSFHLIVSIGNLFFRNS